MNVKQFFFNKNIVIRKINDNCKSKGANLVAAR